MKRQSVISIGENRDKPRIWIQGRYLEQAGFNRGTPIRISYQDKAITIEPVTEGENHVSGTGNRAPIIDINTLKISESFPKTKKVKVTVESGRISISQSMIDMIRERPYAGTAGEIFAGGGLLAKSGSLANLKAKWMIESNREYADVLADNFDCDLHISDVADVMLEDLDEVDVLLGGIPCTPFSKLRQNGCDHDDHKDMDTALFVLPIIFRTKPKYIIFEEVPQFIKTETGKALINALKRMGYNVSHQVVNGDEYGEPTRRGRIVILATVDEMDFPEIESHQVRLQDLLLPYDHPECEWWTRETKSWVFEHWEKQTAKGNNFASQIIEYHVTDRVQAITRRYFAQQAGNPVVRHPINPDMYRWLTLSEVRKIMGLPDDYKLNTSKTTAGEILGQGVLVRIFSRIISKVIQ